MSAYKELMAKLAAAQKEKAANSSEIQKKIDALDAQGMPNGFWDKQKEYYRSGMNSYDAPINEINKGLSELKNQQDTALNSINADNFLGFDDNGNAIVKQADGKLQSYGGEDWQDLNNSVKQKFGQRSFNDYIGNEQLKGLGAEYQGIDEETGNAIFTKDGKTFGVDKNDAQYKNLMAAAQRTAPAKSWFNPEYEKQFKAVTDSGSQFSGFNDAGEAMFKNKLGQYDAVQNKDAGFYKFAKKNLSDQKFQGVQGAATNQTAGENITPMGQINTQAKVGTDQDKIRRSLSDNKGGFSRFQASANPTQAVGVTPTTPPVNNYAPPKIGATTAPTAQYSATSQAKMKQARTKKAQTPQFGAPADAPQFGIKDIATSMGKEYATNFANQKAAEVKSNLTNQATTAIQPFKDQAFNAVKTTTGIDPAKSITNQLTSGLSNATGVNAGYLTDPKAAALGDVSKQAGFDVKAAIADPAKYSMSQAGNALSGQVGFDVNSAIANPVDAAKNKALDYLGTKTGYDLQGAVNNPKDFLINKGVDMLGQYAGADTGALGKAAGLLRGNVIDNARKMAEAEAKKQALAQIGSATGVDVNAIQGGIDVGKDLIHGGVDQDTARMAGQTIARGAIATASGGVVSPETLALSSQLQNDIYQKMQQKLGTVGAIAASPLRLASLGSQAGSELLNSGINMAGDSAAGTYNDVKQAGGGLKDIFHGDLGGFGDIANAALSNVKRSIVDTPLNAGKAIVSSVSKAISGLFCFDADTEILMEDGSYKKIKDIKLGDKIELGGLVTAVGQSASNEIYDYNGVKVSGGHAVFENGKWTRVAQSQHGKEMKGDERVVYPMSTEHHLIVTKGQIWADLLEVNDKPNKTESDAMEELNSKKQRNKMLKVYTKVKFGIS